MNFQKKTSFSSDGSKFAYINEQENLLIWDTISNKLINFDLIVNTCSCIRWIPMQQKYKNSKKAKLCNEYVFEEIMLASGTDKGDVLIYNVETKTLFLHMAGRHNGAINDMCLCRKSNSFFTCSSDQHIAAWDISTGKLISKWKAGENPVSTICAIDDDNLLSSSKEILWWNISKKEILKRFSGHATEIIKLLPVNVDSMKSCYFLSAAVGDTKINAWSLTSSACEESVVSFSLPLPSEDIDISKVSSKDKPLILSAVTKDGHLHIYEHALNGNISELVHSKVSIQMDLECRDFSVLSVKLTDDGDGCIVAYGSSKSDIAFKHVKIKDFLQKGEKGIANSVNRELSIKLSSTNNLTKTEKTPPVNGVSDVVISSYKSRLRSSMKSSVPVPDLVNPTERQSSLAKVPELPPVEDLDLDDPKSAVDALLEAIETRNDNIIETIFRKNAESMSSIVTILPTSSLKMVLKELNHRLLQKYSITICRWLKEILQVHLRYLTECDDVADSLNQSRNLLSSLNIRETLHKMTVARGLLNLHTQDSSSNDESASDDDESMELL